MPQKCLSMSFVVVALLVLMPWPALAQTPFAPPPQIPYGLSVSTESAKHAATAAIAEAQKNNWKMAIAVVDTGGYLVYFEKMQDTQTDSVELAIEKARTAALFRRPTKVFQQRGEENPWIAFLPEPGPNKGVQATAASVRCAPAACRACRLAFGVRT